MTGNPETERKTIDVIPWTRISNQFRAIAVVAFVTEATFGLLARPLIVIRDAPPFWDHRSVGSILPATIAAVLIYRSKRTDEEMSVILALFHSLTVVVVGVMLEIALVFSTAILWTLIWRALGL